MSCFLGLDPCHGTPTGMCALSAFVFESKAKAALGRAGLSVLFFVFILFLF